MVLEETSESTFDAGLKAMQLGLEHRRVWSIETGGPLTVLYRRLVVHPVM